MIWKYDLPEKPVVFKRLSLSIGEGLGTTVIPSRASNVQQQPLRTKVIIEKYEEYRVLVINASQEMAKEITLQLSLQIPGCSLMYAPTLQLAAWMLKRRPINLIVSDPILPDGNVTKLREVLEDMEAPPDILVVGGINEKSIRAMGASGYTFSEIRRDAARRKAMPLDRKDEPAPLSQAIKGLGADIRNDLNNPLQEIVAMVFVARTTSEREPAVDLALNAIEKAATNMSGVVRGIEDKIFKVVQG